VSGFRCQEKNKAEVSGVRFQVSGTTEEEVSGFRFQVSAGNEEV
jgi:hypothetical protein